MLVLDHGYTVLVESWGSDEQIIEAARMSTGKGFLGWGPKKKTIKQCEVCMIRSDETTDREEECVGAMGGNKHQWLRSFEIDVPGDEKLLRYLWTKKHHTPFEMAGATFEIQAPIVVFREWHRHRTQSYNEKSARYVVLPNVNYLPTLERCLTGAALAGGNKQAQAAVDKVDQAETQMWLDSLESLYIRSENVYEQGLRAGVPKELARLAVTVGRYSTMRASANLRNWLGFLTLRTAPDAQWEIRQYAIALEQHLIALFPRTLALFKEGRR